MTGIKRFTGIALVVSMMMFIMAPAAAIAVEEQTTIGPPSYNVTFDAPDLPNGATYDLTVDSTTYNLIAVTGVDKTISVIGGNTIAVTYSQYAYESSSIRRNIGTQPPPANFNITGPLNVSQGYPFTEIKLTADQTGLPVGTEYIFNHMMAISTDILTAGTPFDFWNYISGGVGYVVFDFQDPVPTEFGLYPLISTVPESGFGFTVPRTIMATYASGAVGGEVYNDLNNNGVRDPGETGIAGATVELIGGAIDNGPIEDTSFALAIPDGLSVFGTVQSGPDGEYNFDGVPAGTFYVRITLPNGGIQESPPVTLVIDGTGVTTGTADFPEGVAGPSTLPYTGR